ncbi:MAG TPA: hypothetical protein VGM39_21200 [Kofleriaceae bacterium]|jgi:DNA topoisomerase-1
MLYVHADAPGLTRHKRGKSFGYTTAQGKPVRDKETLSRIRALAIPPAWTHVWICGEADGHLQATGRDARGRKQYRYHTRWREKRDEAKYNRLVDFCRVLPRLRAAVEKDLACSCLCKRKVIATVVALMERAQLRVGNDEYAKANGSYGATTLQDRHATFHGDTLELAYRAKGGIARRVQVTDRKLARIVRQCRDVPGQRLFQYVDGDQIGHITSNDVNDYLRENSGGPFTAKDYRTWAATLGAAMLLCSIEHPDSERKCKACVKEVIGAVADKLGHTPTICRKSYIHPRVIDDFSSGTLERHLAKQMKRRVKEVAIDASAIDVTALRAVEPVVARYLESTVRKQRRA